MVGQVRVGYGIFVKTEFLKGQDSALFEIFTNVKCLNNQNYKKCQHKHEFLPPAVTYLYSIAYAHLPNHDEKFWTKERRLVFGPL